MVKELPCGCIRRRNGTVLCFEARQLWFARFGYREGTEELENANAAFLDHFKQPVLKGGDKCQE